jgi:hypothetical protein
MNDRDIDTAYAENEAQEDLRWIEKAIPHATILAAQLLAQGRVPAFAAANAVKTYVLIEQALINETAGK